MAIAPKQIGKTFNVANIASGTWTPPAIIEQYRNIVFTQNTASISVTLPTPVDSSTLISLDIVNNGFASITVNSYLLLALSGFRVTWTGTQWVSIGRAVGASAVLETYVQYSNPNSSTYSAVGFSTTFTIVNALSDLHVWFSSVSGGVVNGGDYFLALSLDSATPVEIFSGNSFSVGGGTFMSGNYLFKNVISGSHTVNLYQKNSPGQSGGSVYGEANRPARLIIKEY